MLNNGFSNAFSMFNGFQAFIKASKTDSGIEDILLKNNRIMEFSDFKTIIQRRKNKKALYNKVKKNFEENKKIKASISKRLNYDMKEEFNPEDFFYDEEYQGYEVYIDESLKKQKNKPDKAGYGIHFMRKHKHNFYERVDGEQTLQNATY